MDERLRGAPQTGPQPGGDIPVGLKAAQGDARPDGRHQVARAAAEVPDHGLRGPGGDAQGGAPPSGVDCRGHLLPGVAQQHRDTVGGKDGQTQAGGPGDQAVGLYSTGRARGGEHIGPGDRADQIDRSVRAPLPGAAGCFVPSCCPSRCVSGGLCLYFAAP